MHIDCSPLGATLDPNKLEQVQDKLSQTLEMLDYWGVSGVIAVCVLPDGASYVTSGGTCVDLDGAMRGLYAGITAIRDLAATRGVGELATHLTEAVEALRPALSPVGEPAQVH